MHLGGKGSPADLGVTKRLKFLGEIDEEFLRFVGENDERVLFESGVVEFEGGIDGASLERFVGIRIGGHPEGDSAGVKAATDLKRIAWCPLAFGPVFHDGAGSGEAAFQQEFLADRPIADQPAPDEAIGFGAAVGEVGIHIAKPITERLGELILGKPRDFFVEVFDADHEQNHLEVGGRIEGHGGLGGVGVNGLQKDFVVADMKVGFVAERSRGEDASVAGVGAIAAAEIDDLVLETVVAAKHGVVTGNLGVAAEADVHGGAASDDGGIADELLESLSVRRGNGQAGLHATRKRRHKAPGTTSGILKAGGRPDRTGWNFRLTYKPIENYSFTLMTLTADWTREEIAALNDRFEQQALPDILHWAFETFGSRAQIGTSFQGAGLVTIDHALKAGLTFPVFTIDTGLLFPETLELKKRLEDFWGIEIESIHPERTVEQQNSEEGPELWKTRPDLCCTLRKVMPLQNKLHEIEAWITGLRRQQSETREQTQILEVYKFDVLRDRKVVKLNPMANWSRDEVWDYLRANGIPYNPLTDRGYRSIGCLPCTKAVNGDAHERAGRWIGFDKAECGIHTFLGDNI